MRGKLAIFGNQRKFKVLGKLCGICLSLSRESFTYFVSVQRVFMVLQAFLSRDSIQLSRRSFGICPEIHLSLSRSSLNHFDFCPGGHNELLFLSRGSQQFTVSVQGVTTTYYFCPGSHNELLFLSRGSQRLTISVPGVTMSYYFCPRGHSVFFLLSLSGESLWTFMHVQGGI